MKAIECLGEIMREVQLATAFTLSTEFDDGVVFISADENLNEAQPLGYLPMRSINFHSEGITHLPSSDKIVPLASLAPSLFN